MNLKLIGSVILATLLLAGCDNRDSKIVSKNLSTAADQFEINRRIVFYNGITDNYILTIEGLCSIDTSATGRTFFVICKTGPREYKKHFLGLSDNVTFFAEQLQPAKTNAFHYRVIFKPQSIIPDIDVTGSGKALIDIVR